MKYSALADGDGGQSESLPTHVKLLQPGQQAPDFQTLSYLPNGTVREVALTDYQGKYLIVVFFPADLTWTVSAEVRAFCQRVEEFRVIGAEIIGVYNDSLHSQLPWDNIPSDEGVLGPTNITLLADKNQNISLAYGVRNKQRSFRGLFIIDDSSKLRHFSINDHPVGLSVDEAIRLVQAFQFTDKHNELCPAGWKPGKKTLKQNTEGLSKYL